MVNVLDEGDSQDVRAIFAFDSSDSEIEVLKKFELWGRYFHPQYFKSKDADFHRDIDQYNLQVYSSDIRSFTDIVFRGGAKTTRTKLLLAFCISNDLDHYRKYIKILTKDINNAKQIVTDIYNMLIALKVRHFYPEIFVKTVEKREETMASFTTAFGVKVKAGSVGTDQRGQLQEDSRPDFIWFDDFETRKTLRSAVETKAIWDNMEEARTGLSLDGGAVYTCNYLSERGNVHKLVENESAKNVVLIVPIKDQQNRPMWPEAYTIERINQIEQDADDFEGEYMCEPSAGHDIYFDRASLDEQIKRTPIRIIADFKIFHAYNPSHRYGVGADVAGGVGLDSSTSVIIDFTTLPYKVVATFKNNLIKPDTFGDELKSEGDRFGACIIAPEKNNHGHATIGRLRQIYDNIYFTEEKEVRVGIPPRTKEYGWHTNAFSKPMMLADLKKAVEDGFLQLSDEDLIKELKGYTRDDMMDKEDDPRLSTRHFDLLIACGIALQMKDFATKKSEATGYQQSEYEKPTLE